MGNRAKQPRSFNTIRHTHTKERADRRRLGRVVLLLMAALVALLLLATLALGICAIADAIISAVNEGQTTEGDPQTPATPGTPKYDQLYTAQETDIGRGELVLVNSTHAYRFPTSETNLIDVTVARSQIDKANFYQINTALIGNTPRVKFMKESAFTAFESMMRKYYEVSEKDASVRLNDAYRTWEVQGSFEVPQGESDHHTGYCISLKKYDSAQGTYVNLPSDNWILQNCHKYGFIQRYPNEKKDKTGIEDYEYCLRYVGVAHATYITEHALCLEEYIETLPAHTKDNPLSITGADGKSYEVFYVPALKEPVGALTNFYVPSNYSYTVSGDNIGGLIVTVNLSDPKE